MKRLVPVLLLSLAGCAPIGEAECRSTDWYALGEIEGRIYGMRPRIDQYADQCGRHGVQPGEKEYMAGWLEGYREWEMRTMADFIQ
ncbi:MAG TPA: DUF2799 domain-containing protein [Burkholderiales bacterium]|nr:DUF2799 domain-containing protein [Burkholderiales bacterium]